MNLHLTLYPILLLVCSVTQAADTIHIDGALAPLAFTPGSAAYMNITTPEGAPATLFLVSSAPDICSLLKRDAQQKGSTSLFVVISDALPGRHAINVFHVARGDAGFAAGALAKLDDNCTDENADTNAGVMVGGQVTLDKTQDEVWHGSLNVDLGNEAAPWSHITGLFTATHCDMQMGQTQGVSCG